MTPAGREPFSLASIVPNEMPTALQKSLKFRLFSLQGTLTRKPRVMSGVHKKKPASPETGFCDPAKISMAWRNRVHPSALGQRSRE